jgi:hypothetical protein
MLFDSRQKPPQMIYHSNEIIQNESVGQVILDKLKSKDSLLISRFGSEELKSLKEFRLRSFNLLRRYKHYKMGWIDNFTSFSHENIHDKTFLWHSFNNDWDNYYFSFLKSMPEIDVLGSWLFWESIFKAELKSSIKVKLSRLEPYYHDVNWLSALRDKKVLVIHPMKDSILRQFEKKDLLFKEEYRMPDFELDILQALYFDDETYNTWPKMYNYYLNEVEKYNFEIAIIGNGSWGMPLGAHLKGMGKKVIHLGGSVQLLFGIMGNRWFNDYPFVRNLMNEHWIYPNSKETPKWSVGYDKKAYW